MHEIPHNFTPMSNNPYFALFKLLNFEFLPFSKNQLFRTLSPRFPKFQLLPTHPFLLRCFDPHHHNCHNINHHRDHHCHLYNCAELLCKKKSSGDSLVDAKHLYFDYHDHHQDHDHWSRWWWLSWWRSMLTCTRRACKRFDERSDKSAGTEPSLWQFPAVLRMMMIMMIWWTWWSWKWWWYSWTCQTVIFFINLPST